MYKQAFQSYLCSPKICLKHIQIQLIKWVLADLSQDYLNLKCTQAYNVRNTAYNYDCPKK